MSRSKPMLGADIEIVFFKTEMLFKSPEDEILVGHGGEDWKICNLLNRKEHLAEFIGTRNPPQLLLFIDRDQFMLGFKKDDDPEDLARRLNRWLELARESKAK